MINKNKKTVIVVALTVLLAGGYLLFFQKQPDLPQPFSDKKMQKPARQVDYQATDETLYYDNLPFYPGITELGREMTEGDGITASYQTPDGITGKQVLDFYEKQLISQGWKINLRDTNDSRLEALSIDEVQLRIWIYYDGSDGSGTNYNIDFRIPGSEPWPPLPNQ
jgi:hypothetical protein